MHYILFPSQNLMLILILYLEKLKILKIKDNITLQNCLLVYDFLINYLNPLKILLIN